MYRGLINFFNSLKEYFLFLILLVISLVLISLQDSPRLKALKTIAIGNFAFINNTTESFLSILSDDDEIKELKKINAKLMLEVNELRKYGIQNYELKQLLEYYKSVDYELVISSIISKNPSDVQGHIIINSGLQDSIRTGLPVINEKGLIGVVDIVTDNFAVVKTLRSPSLKIACEVERSGVNGILSWNGIDLIMQNIPTTSDIEKGDRIVSSDFSTILPPSIPIGIVKDSETNLAGVLSNFFIETYVDFDKINNVIVVKFIPEKEDKELFEDFPVINKNE